MSNAKFGRGLAKAVGIDVDYRSRDEPRDFVDSAAASIQPVDPYYEEEPSLREVLDSLLPTRAGVAIYIRSLFPFWSWIFHYNMTWAFGDFIAGITVGFVVIPQGMAYALLAELPPEYGLYTSFVGFLLYWAFATSKDITIGTVAVMSTLVGTIIQRVQAVHGEDAFPPEMIARGLSIIVGAALLFIGLARLGWVVEFIPLVGITSFMTGAAISIAAGQVPALLGISGVKTREATYLVIINTLKSLPRAKLDAAMGVSALAMLYLIRFGCNFMARRQPHRQKLWFFVGTLRMAFVILLYILISWLVNRNINWDASKAAFRVLGNVPSGFQVHSAPMVNTELLSALAPDIPAAIIVAIIEHIAISKSFGRINNYVIDPSQELVAVGFTNVLGPFLGAYPATGSFSRTAIKSKAGVRTPLAGLWTAVIVLLALYALTSVFFYIPMASLAGLIIHAVGDLITPPHTVYRFWQVSPLEALIFLVTVILMVFTDLETGIYFAICFSVAVVLVRIAKTHGRFLGHAKIYRIDRNSAGNETSLTSRDAYLPLDHRDGTNPDVHVEVPFPGVIVYRFSEGFNYINAGRNMDLLTATVMKETRPTVLNKYSRLGDRPWNDPGPRRGKQPEAEDSRPPLRAVILDCAAVSGVDATAMQALVDTREQLDRHAAPDAVEWHVANLNSRWARRAFAAVGFGYPLSRAVGQLGSGDGAWKPIFSVAATMQHRAGDGSADVSAGVGKRSRVRTNDEEAALEDVDRVSSSDNTNRPGDGNGGRGRTDGGLPENAATVHGVNRPWFHIDVASAVESTVASIEGRVNREKAQ
ncbi:hypothetical protein DL764_001615 [Monosporascus ibericus]|uniref:STAS domain-containing protein n=1 Tax=Monosporascus ibericus TaxID=155417 RepID=A0A4Q4TNW1_9PEZI|nr:hypothetical protein DL764_001615 [Monosporascus ibericus]